MVERGHKYWAISRILSSKVTLPRLSFI